MILLFCKIYGKPAYRWYMENRRDGFWLIGAWSAYVHTKRNLKLTRTKVRVKMYKLEELRRRIGALETENLHRHAEYELIKKESEAHGNTCLQSACSKTNVFICHIAFRGRCKNYDR